MPDSDSSPHDPIGGLLKKAAAATYCRPALQALGADLPPDDDLLAAALHLAAERRDAKPFSHLYIAALFADRQVPARVLELGAALLPEALLLLDTALRLDGPVAEPLAAAVRSGRMGGERDAAALVAAWLDYERRETTPPRDFLILTRKTCRTCSRTGGLLSRPLLCVVAKLSGDPVAASILHAVMDGDPGLDKILERLRDCASGTTWRNAIPLSPRIESALAPGSTLKRAAPKAGRNDPCPCGSGRKFKQCCEGKTEMARQYEVDGVTLSDAEAHPELLLTPARIREMRSYELFALDPHRLVPPYAGQVALRLVVFGETPRAIEILKAKDPDSIPKSTLDDIAFEFYSSRDADALRWLVEWAPGAIELTFEKDVLLADPAERFRLLQERARDAFDAEQSGETSAAMAFCDVGFGALAADPALGILIARGVLPVCGWANQPTLIEDIEDARDHLGLDNDEPGYEILEAADKLVADDERHEADLEKVRKESAAHVTRRDAEIQRLKSRIDEMQDTLARQEKKAREEKPQTGPFPESPPPAAADPAETRDLRDQLRRLKDNLKIEHDERNRAMRDLRAAKEQLRRASREASETTSPEASPDTPPDAETSATTGVEWERQPLRIPEFGKAFRNALHQHPRQASAAAISAAGRLAAGDPSIWKTVRALRMRPGTLRVRIAGEYRLLFETGPGDTLHLIDLILRRDLDRWLAGGGH